MTRRRIRVGAIGAGWWATTNHFPLLAADDRVELAGVSSLGLEHLTTVQRAFGFSRITEDYRELLDWDLDALVVASPHHLHHEHAAAGLDRGLVVLCEKPMALTARDAWDLVDRSTRDNAALIVSLGWNYKPFLVRAERLMRSSGVGTIQFVTVRMASPTKAFFSHATPTVPSDFAAALTGPDPMTWQDPRHGGGYIHGQLSHAVGLLFWLTPLRASAVTARASSPGANVDLYDAALIDFVGGSHGAVTGAATLPDDDKFQLGIEIYGTEGVLIVDVERERVELRRHDGRHRHVDVADGDGAYSCEGPVQRFVELAGNRAATNNSPGEVAARGVELLEAIHRSASTGALVEIDQTLGHHQ
ncbi:MAG: Gfo/Idh/MocA family oxidoreductase [Microbacteriaceae bacterium]|nr:MAG: Gfo/Idh/MocA family oxidoreductase [Microbacteriaceae bacterium]